MATVRRLITESAIRSKVTVPEICPLAPRIDIDIDTRSTMHGNPTYPAGPCQR
jgi:hypothetical protein